MKKLFSAISITALVLLAGFIVSKPVFSQEQKEVNIYMFWSEGCPHCAKEKEFLNQLKKEKPNINVKSYEVSKSFKNAVLFSQVGKYLEVDTSGVPFTVIGSEEFTGFGSAQTTGQQFITAIEKVEAGEDEDVLQEFFEQREKENGKENSNDKKETIQERKEKYQGKIPDKIDLSIFGEIDPSKFSLPVLTFIIALVDGFNPCAMWVLLFLISLLLGFEDKKRMWILGLTFIAASAFVYFLFMAAWLNFFLFFGFIIWVRIAVGLVALYFAYRNIRSFIENDDDGCEVTENEKRVKTLEKIKQITKKKNLLPALGGIILLAFAVNLIEAVCSAGLPAVYTQILTLNDLSTFEYYMYIVLYQLVFMLDDMAIFIIAMLTMQSVGIESKYARASKIVGGIIMLIIGLLLIFKPELLLIG